MLNILTKINNKKVYPVTSFLVIKKLNTTATKKRKSGLFVQLIISLIGFISLLSLGLGLSFGLKSKKPKILVRNKIKFIKLRRVN